MTRKRRQNSSVFVKKPQLCAKNQCYKHNADVDSWSDLMNGFSIVNDMHLKDLHLKDLHAYRLQVKL